MCLQKGKTLDNTPGKAETSLDCPVCHVTLANLEKKKAHVKNIHHNLRTFECRECPEGTIFHSQLHFKAHQKATHGGITSTPGSLHCEYHNCKQPVKNSIITVPNTELL